MTAPPATATVSSMETTLDRPAPPAKKLFRLHWSSSLPAANPRAKGRTDCSGWTTVEAWSPADARILWGRAFNGVRQRDVVGAVEEIRSE